VNALVEDSTEILEWLLQLGVKLESLSKLGGHSHRRTHRLRSGPVGWAIVETVFNKMTGKNIYNIKSVKVEEITKNENNV